MCTLSWIRDETGYQLFFNRDEKRTRKQALPPRLHEREPVRFLAPVDGDFGGTWIAASEFGISVCLLNGANLTGSTAPDRATLRSRGLLLPDLMFAPSVDELREHLLAANLSDFAPFTLAALGPGQPAALIEWDGFQKTVRFQDQQCFMLTSSSFDTELVRASRAEQFRIFQASRPRIGAESLMQFHSSHLPQRSAYSTCMHRADAETVSFSRIQVSREVVQFHYTPAAPCQQHPGPPLILARRDSKA